MSIELHCPQCQKSIKAPDSAGGKHGKCPYCKASVYIPDAHDNIEILSITPIDGSDEYWAKHRELVAERIARGIAAPAEDPDVLFTVPDLNSHRRMDLIADALDGRGHPDRVIEKVIGGNRPSGTTTTTSAASAWR